MICRKIHQKTPWSFRQWWLCSYSAKAPKSMDASVAAASTNFELGLISRAKGHTCTNSRMLFFSKNYRRGDSFSIPIWIQWSCMTTQATDLPVGMVVDVPLAQTGEGIAECELLKWFVQEGDHVEEFQPLCEVQSDKATIEITSRYKGKISTVLHVPGSIVKVGETLLKLVVDENAFYNEGNEAIEFVKKPDSTLSDSSDDDSALSKGKSVGVWTTPAVRSLAKQLSINIEDVLGTGKDGRILKEDVLNYASQVGIVKENSAAFHAPSAEQVFEGGKKSRDMISAYGWKYEDRTLSLRGFQRAMVKSMTLAAKIPHFYYVEEINCNALVELKASFQKENSDPSVKFTFLPLLIKALSMALSKYPSLNSCFNEGSHEVILKGIHNIGIAMATPHGLVVPNIKEVQSLSILEITRELSRLQQLALANKLSPEDIASGTITLSNIGAIGGKFGCPLINVPEVSIIAIGQIQRVPRYDKDGNVNPASIMTVNIGADHRVLDGATVAMFCNEWKLFIEKPELLMLYMR